MAIDATKGQTGAPAAGAMGGAPINPTSQLGKQDFMKLLVAQLKNQDPLNPMDSREMITQLSTLTNVEKLTSVDQSLSQLRAETTGMAGMQTSSLIGRTVTADATRLTVTGFTDPTANYTLDGAAKSVTATVRDAQGNIVRTLELGAQPAGSHTLTWDGNNAEGQGVPLGTYSFELAAKSDAGHPVPASSQVTGVVSEVSFKSGKAELVIGDAQVSVGDVVAIQK